VGIYLVVSVTLSQLQTL